MEVISPEYDKRNGAIWSLPGTLDVEFTCMSRCFLLKIMGILGLITIFRSAPQMTMGNFSHVTKVIFGGIFDRCHPM